MADYIDRKTALSFPFANEQYDHENANEDFILGCETYKEWLENLPVANVQEVIHAHWEKLANGYGFVCSNCRVREKRSAVFNGTHKFCYKCGARMDGKENEK